MVTWREIGLDNYTAAKQLFQAGNYRSSVSRSYYAGYSVLAHELLLTSFQPKAERQAPDHAHLPEWIKNYLTHLSVRRRVSIATLIRQLYDDRLTADYKLWTVDKPMAREALRNVASLFESLGITL